MPYIEEDDTPQILIDNYSSTLSNRAALKRNVDNSKIVKRILRAGDSSILTGSKSKSGYIH
jgi:hypothetical protein